MNCFFTLRENGGDQLCDEQLQVYKIGLRALHCRFSEEKSRYPWTVWRIPNGSYTETSRGNIELNHIGNINFEKYSLDLGQDSAGFVPPYSRDLHDFSWLTSWNFVRNPEQRSFFSLFELHSLGLHWFFKEESEIWSEIGFHLKILVHKMNCNGNSLSTSVAERNLIYWTHELLWSDHYNWIQRTIGG